jgi:hypothetical protein
MKQSNKELLERRRLEIQDPENKTIHTITDDALISVFNIYQYDDYATGSFDEYVGITTERQELWLKRTER